MLFRSASAAGMSVAADDNPRLLAKLPMELKALGFSAHKDMDALADAAQKGVPYTEIMSMLGTSMTKCVACHQTWQIGLERNKFARLIWIKYALASIGGGF